MSIVATLYVEEKKYNILSINIKIHKEVGRNGLPSTGFMGGFFDLEIEASKDTTIYDWMLRPEALKDAKIIIPSRFGTSNTRTIDLKDVYCIAHNDFFNSTSAKPMTTKFRLSPGGVYNNGKEVFVKHWHVPKPEIKKEEKQEKEEKKVILTFKANSSDVEAGKFGFDRFNPDYKDIYTGNNFSNLENEYKPIQVYGEKYFPVWVSMRKGQTITLDLEKIKLGKIKTENYKLFDEIKFANHPDFTFEPSNLKDASEVHITCNNTGSQTQIKIEGDGVEVGAINFFYPEPKEVNVRWVVVEFNKGDKTKLSAKYNSDILKKYFKTSFNPALIDIKIVNERSEVLDLTIPSRSPAELGFINLTKTNLVEGTKDSVKQDDLSKTNFMTSLNTIHRKRQESEFQTGDIYLYLSNIKSSSEKESLTESDKMLISSNNGASSGNVCFMFLGNDSQLMNPTVEIPHEVMHSLGLQHTFIDKGTKLKKHTFKISKTRNYMDYDNTKDSTFFWQWELLH